MPAVLSRLARPRKSQFRQLEFFNEGIDRPDRIVFSDPILQPFGEQD